MASSTALPDSLINSLLNDQLVLFLGAGTSIGAVSPNNEEPPTGNALRDRICDRFFSGKLKDRSLPEVCDYVINEYDIRELQEFIRTVFFPLEPADFHKLIPQFPWHAIVTTNFDLVIERAYHAEPKRVRGIEPFIKNGDKIDVKLKRSHTLIQYIKLHGCIDHYSDISIPLILSAEQLTKFSPNRDRLFERFKDLGRQCSLVFCGYSLNDSNVREILFDLTDAGIERPRYYLVKPNIDEYQQRYWQKHRFTLIDSTFGDFLKALSAQVSQVAAATATIALPGATTLHRYYSTSTPKETPTLIEFLKSDVTHIRPGMPVAGSSAKQFYSGYDEGWWPIEQKLDVYRTIIDSIMVEAILKPVDRKSGVDLFVIKGAAGNGKTVALKRVAWDGANDYDQVVLYHNEGGALTKQCLQEIHDLTNRRIFLCVDHVALYVEEVTATIEFCIKQGIPLTVIATERDNEWNVRCGPLDRFVVNDFPIGYLSEKEVHTLLQKLEEHKCLGALQAMSPEKRAEAFINRAQRQLLVALHEVTLGKPFEDIIRDEYERIIPEEARFLYLDICTLNRLGVSVRAGLIARISGISFERFQRDFFGPLELLIKTSKHPYLQDHAYEARHPYVAELVFGQACKSAEDKYEQIVRLLKGLNIDYSSDDEAFHSLIRGRHLQEVFPPVELGRSLFDVAHSVAKESAFVFHQEAVFEMAHGSGSLVRAQKAIDRAREIAPWDRSIQHTVANLKRKMAHAARTPLEKAKLRAEAKSLLSGMLSDDPESYGLLTYAQLLLDELEELVSAANQDTKDSEESTLERRVAENVKVLEKTIASAIQRFPEKEQFSVLDERFSSLLSNNERAQKALERAFATNPRNEYIASRLAARFESANNFDAARKTLRKCLEDNPGAKLVHLKLALLFMKHGTPAEKALVIEHLRKSFTEGDSNVLAQFWYARELFLTGRYADAKELFDRFAETRISSEMRNDVRGNVREDNGTIKRFRGKVIMFEGSFGFLRSPSYPVDIFCQSKDTQAAAWENISRNAEVEFTLAFTMRGPRARDITII